jgi:hypothetical protein
MGAKMTPTAKKRGRTVFGVRMGCHAFKRCCRKALSARVRQHSHSHSHPPPTANCQLPTGGISLGGLRLFWPFLWLSAASSLPRALLESVCSTVRDIWGTSVMVAAHANTSISVRFGG